MKKAAKKSSPKHVVKDGVHGCLISGEPPPPGRKLIRGLSEKHYKRFQRIKDGFANEDDARAFDEKAVAAGLILPKDKGGPRVVDNPFEQLRLSMLPEKVRKDVEEGIAASKKLTEDQKKKPGNSNK